MVPPDPIPNSEVKRRCADGSVGHPHVRVGHRQVLNVNPELKSLGFLFMDFLRRYPRMKFDTSLLLNLFAAAAMLVMGFRSFSKKHQMKFSDDEERAMWEKKFGVFYFFNAVVFAASPFLPHTSIGGSRLLSIGIAADTVFLLMYHAWKKGREDD